MHSSSHGRNHVQLDRILTRPTIRTVQHLHRASNFSFAKEQKGYIPAHGSGTIVGRLGGCISKIDTLACKPQLAQHLW